MKKDWHRYRIRIFASLSLAVLFVLEAYIKSRYEVLQCDTVTGSWCGLAQFLASASWLIAPFIMLSSFLVFLLVHMMWRKEKFELTFTVAFVVMTIWMTIL